MINEVSLVILNYKNWQDTLECLASVFDITYHPYRVIVVDNDSQNGSLDEIRKWLTARRIQPLCLTQEQSEKDDYDDNHVVLIQSNSNRGYAAGNNIGIRWAIRAGSPYVMILNNDTVVQKDFIEPMVVFLNNNPDTAMVGPKILDLDGNIDHNCSRRRPTIIGYFCRFGIIKILFPRNKYILRNYYIGEYDFNYPKEVDVLSGSCLLIRSEILINMNYLDEATFLYLEEFILCENIKYLKKEAFIVPESVIIHKKGLSIKNQPSLFVLKSELDSFHYYLTKYRNFPLIVVYMIMHHSYLRYYYWKYKYIISNKNKSYDNYKIIS